MFGRGSATASYGNANCFPALSKSTNPLNAYDIHANHPVDVFFVCLFVLSESKEVLCLSRDLDQEEQKWYQDWTGGHLISLLNYHLLIFTWSYYKQLYLSELIYQLKEIRLYLCRQQIVR